MRLIHRLLIIAATPLAILLLMSAIGLGESLSDRSRATKVIAGVNAVNLAGDLIHTLQAERGASAGFIGSRGKSFRSELSQRRSSTNTAISAFGDNVNAASGLKGQLATIEQMRTQVDGLKTPVGAMASTYTTAINMLFDFAEEQVSRDASAEVNARAEALLALMGAKESAGLERAMGANGFGGGRFAPAIYNRYVLLQGAQKAYFSKALSKAASVDTRAIKAVLEGAASARVNELRANASAMALSSAPPKVSGPEWFSASTVRIDELRDVEQRLGSTLKIAAEAGVAEATKGVLFHALTAILSVAIAMGVAVLSAMKVSKPIRQVNQSMSRIASGKYETKVPATKRSDEIGDLARGLKSFRDELSKAAETNEVAMFKGQAYDGSISPMIMTDTNGTIKYMNKATMQMFRDHREMFETEYPGFNADKMIGTSFDQFHANPGHQRGIVSDPNRLPFRTEIKIGSFYFSMAVTGVFDRDGNHVGCTLEWQDVSEMRRNEALLNAIETSQAVIEFTPEGKVVNANENFLTALNYTKDEVIGQHHSIFMPTGEADTPEYKDLWRRLSAGESVQSQFRRRRKDGSDIWIQATYNGLRDSKGVVYRVIKIASDITETKTKGIRLETERKERELEVQMVIDNLAVSLRGLSNGDLTNEITAQFAETFKGLRMDYNQALEKLRIAMSEVITNAHAIRTGAGEITQAADDLSRRTENQAATLEETAASLEELTVSVRAAAEGATETNQVVSEAKSNAESSGLVVREAVAAMSEIEHSSKQISQIIGVIDDIAFQTNLLALNAGVEAARAGDAGRGFAVVASEVRALAQRSSDAAKEIKAHISSSTQQVERGVDLVGQAGKALEEIVTSVVDISSRVNEIASSAKEQSTGIEGINSAMNKMDQVTQQNAAMVQESTAASHTLNQDANSLIKLISQFQTGLATEEGSNQTLEDRHPRELNKLIAEAAPKIRQAAGSGASAQVEEDWQEF
ncbi:MAG: methyl-accepting chemotaxis protein [Pseudomonadota bacterium]